jgi:hypothetical protein
MMSNGAAKITNKILIDHTKQNNTNSILSPSASIKTEHINTSEPSSLHSNVLHPSLLSSPRSAFSRTSKSSITPQGFLSHSPDQRRITKGKSNLFVDRAYERSHFSFQEEADSPSSHRSQSHSTSLNLTTKSTPIHPTILSGDVTPSSHTLPPPPPLLIPSTLNDTRDNDLLTTTDINDDGNTSDSSANGNHEWSGDDGPVPLTCDRGEQILWLGTSSSRTCVECVSRML